MDAIEEIKKRGSINALKDEIRSMIHNISGNNWEGIIEKCKFVRLQQSIERARHKLQQMENCLKALQKLEEGNS